MFLKTVRHIKRFFTILVGFTVLLAGVIMLVTPGPGWAAIFAGLAILATAEILWARRLLDRLKERGAKLRDAVFSSNSSQNSTPSEPSK